MRIIALLLYLVFTPLIIVSQIINPQDRWYGLLETNTDKPIFSLKYVDDTIHISMKKPTERIEIKVPDFKISDKSLNFDFVHQNSKWSFSADLNREHMDVLIKRGSMNYQFELFKEMELTQEDLASLPGHYVDIHQKIISIRKSRNRLQMHNDYTGIISSLIKIGDDKYLGPSGEQISYNHKNNQLSWTQHHQKIFFDQQEKVIIEEIQIATREGDTIGGSLFYPQNGKAPFPTLIMVRGAANYDRNILDLEADFFSAHGIACFIYDNFGTGKSTGSLLSKDFEDKKEATKEIFAHIKSLSIVDKNKIGLRGGSQGGRIALMAAAEIPEVAFLILASTPLETRLDQQLYALSHYNRSLGFSEIAISKSSNLWYQYFDNALNQKLDTAFVHNLNQFAQKHPNMALPNANFSAPPDYPWPDDIYDNALDYLPSIQCPVLGIYGTEDNRVPPYKSTNQIQTSGIKSTKIIMYSGANHSFQYPGFIIAPRLFTDQINFIKSL